MALPSNSNSRSQVPITVSFSDTINLIRDQVHWSPKGVRLLTKWPFQEGSEIEFAFDHDGERHCCSGIVVGCHALRQPAGCYEVVLFFIETPCSRLQKAACDCRLASDEQAVQDETHFTTTHHGDPDSVSPINLQKEADRDGRPSRLTARDGSMVRNGARPPRA